MARACVLADLDIVRPLGRAGVRCIAVARGTDPVRWSRFTAAFADRTAWRTPDDVVAGLLALAEREPEPPTLFYANDQDLLLVSRHRAALGRAFRIAIADADLVELLLVKTRAHERFTALGLPVPPLSRLDRHAGRPPDDLRYPVVVKPVVREQGPATGGAAKATRFGSAEELEAAWPALSASPDELLAQQLIEGGEDRIESYHAYVDAAGEIAGEFCGRKLRTFPVRYGNTTALTTTAAEDVRDLGRRVVGGLGLRGVAKVDFKRDPDGRLWLLEVNPRFNLWHHAGACAGVNIPALVHADLTGTPRPALRPPRAGLTWTDPLMDRRARRESGLSMPRWLAWTAGADSRWSIALDDPLPVLRGIVAPFVRRRLPAAG
jgi:D-aspartate ligase